MFNDDVDAEFVEKMGLWTVQTQCDSKDTYLTRPDLGRKLSPRPWRPSRPSAKKNPTRSDLCGGRPVLRHDLQHRRSAAPPSAGLEARIDVGTPFFVKYGRVGVMDGISS